MGSYDDSKWEKRDASWSLVLRFVKQSHKSFSKEQNQGAHKIVKHSLELQIRKWAPND